MRYLVPKVVQRWDEAGVLSTQATARIAILMLPKDAENFHCLKLRGFL